MRKKYTFLTFLSLFIWGSAEAQHIDEVKFGDATSEAQHGLTSYDLSKSEIYTGLAGEKAIRFLPNEGNPFQGGYTGIYGGEVHMVLKVDGTKQNYITAKISGSESSQERILLTVEGKEVGNRYLSDEEFFFGQFYTPGEGTFCFRTVPIPRNLTDGKTFVKIRLRSSGRFYGYGTIWKYETFQRAMVGTTAGLYKLYVHTNPGFSIPTADLAGITPSYANAEKNTANNITTYKNSLVDNANTYFQTLLNGSDFVKTDPNNYFHPVEALAAAYYVPEVTVTYQKQEVIDKLMKFLDNMVRNNYNGAQIASSSWGEHLDAKVMH